MAAIQYKEQKNPWNTLDELMSKFNIDAATISQLLKTSYNYDIPSANLSSYLEGSMMPDDIDTFSFFECVSNILRIDINYFRSIQDGEFFYYSFIPHEVYLSFNEESNKISYDFDAYSHFMSATEETSPLMLPLGEINPWDIFSYTTDYDIADYDIYANEKIYFKTTSNYDSDGLYMVFDKMTNQQVFCEISVEKDSKNEGIPILLPIEGKDSTIYNLYATDRFIICGKLYTLS